jgi:hypothetical protein
MGHECVVSYWTDNGDTDNYHYQEYYEGDSFGRALEAMTELKDRGEKCIRFEWRP